MLLCATAILLPIALWVDRPWTLRPDMLTLGALGGLVVLSTALAYLIYFEILATAGATSVSLVTFLIPVSVLLYSGLFGMSLIFAGLIIIDGRLMALIQRR